MSLQQTIDIALQHARMVAVNLPAGAGGHAVAVAIGGVEDAVDSDPLAWPSCMSLSDNQGALAQLQYGVICSAWDDRVKIALEHLADVLDDWGMTAAAGVVASAADAVQGEEDANENITAVDPFLWLKQNPVATLIAGLLAALYLGGKR
jgi:hypothetical protein